LFDVISQEVCISSLTFGTQLLHPLTSLHTPFLESVLPDARWVLVTFTQWRTTLQNN